MLQILVDSGIARNFNTTNTPSVFIIIIIIILVRRGKSFFRGVHAPI